VETKAPVAIVRESEAPARDAFALWQKAPPDGSLNSKDHRLKSRWVRIATESRLKIVARAFSVPLLHASRAPVCLHASRAPVCAEKKGLGTIAETAASRGCATPTGEAKVRLAGSCPP